MQTRSFILGYFDWTLQPQNKTKMHAQNNPCLGTCSIGDIFVIVHSNSTFKSNMTTIGFDWTIWLGLVNLEY
jgi:hypothetical protein